MENREPQTDQELAAKLRALATAAEYSRGASDDFWDCVSLHVGWILQLVERGAKRDKNRYAGHAGGIARMAALTPEQRREIAKKAAKARWHPPKTT